MGSHRREPSRSNKRARTGTAPKRAVPNRQQHGRYNRRGGTFSTTVGPSGYAITLDKCSFSEDVQVSGTISYVLFSSLNASLTVRGTGTGGGSLNVTGTFVAPGPVGNFQVTGTLGGAAVAVQVPEA